MYCARNLINEKMKAELSMAKVRAGSLEAMTLWILETEIEAALAT